MCTGDLSGFLFAIGETGLPERLQFLCPSRTKRSGSRQLPNCRESTRGNHSQSVATGLRGQAQPSPRERSELDRAIDFLGGALAAGPRRIKEVQDDAIEEDIALRTLRRAKVALGIAKRKFEPWYYWVLPEGEKK